ncbi:hypothetical protein E0L36_08100 [Streptomyces sp. AJS327]|nr:hypothetical protein [Streptomyces sp. AJS327]MBA0050855.1 hypothetical protein [Streptomyces sp. AJS327]
MGGLAELAGLLGGLAPSCGPVRLVAVDGHAGSGKTVFSTRLAAALGGAPVVRLDDLASHARLFDWTERLEEQVLAPLAHGRTARYEVYDWERAAFTGRGEARPAPVVLLEGVGAGRRVVRPSLACLLWMGMPRGTAWERGMRRDGPALSGFWERWTRAERAHFADDPSEPFADFVVRELPRGYEVRRGRTRRP